MKKNFYFQSVFDQDLEVITIGEFNNNTPTIVLLHEGLGSSEMWKDIPDELFKELGLNIFIYSRAGYGKSSLVNLPRPLNYMNIEAEKYLPELLLKFNLKRVFLLGHSDGASIAAINSSLRTNSYKILGSILIAPHFFVEDISLSAINEIKKIYKNKVKDKLSKYHQNVDIAFFGWNDAWLNPEFKNWNIISCLSKINTPVLAIQGEDDPYGSLSQITILESKVLKNFKKLILKECGHNPLIDKPKEVIVEIKNFISHIAKNKDF